MKFDNAHELLLVSAEHGILQGVQKAISNYKDGLRRVELINYPDQRNHSFFDHRIPNGTALMYACISGLYQSECIKFLLENGADASLMADRGQTALHHLVSSAAKFDAIHDEQTQKNIAPLIELLVKNGGADVNAAFDSGKSVLHCAINEFDALISVNAVRKLLELGANPNATFEGGGSVLSSICHIAQQGSKDGLETAKLLLHVGAKIDFDSIKSAVTGNSLELVELLLTYNADVNSALKRDNTISAKIKNIDIAIVVTDHLASSRSASDYCPA